MKPAGFKLARRKQLIIVCLSFIYLFIMFFVIGAEDIREDFSSYNLFYIYFAVFLIVISLSLSISMTLWEKFSKRNLSSAKWLSALGAMLFFICSFYLVIYYMFPQYLSFIYL